MNAVGNRWWGRRHHRRTSQTLAIATLAIALAAPLTVVHAMTSSIVSPTWQRTIGGPATATMYPSGLDVDASGNVYVADTGNYKVEKYQAGTTNLLWSVGVRGAPIGPAGSGNDSFQAPRDVATDGTFVYVADTDNAIIQVLNASDGSFVQAVRTFGGAQKFADPIGVSVGADAAHNELILVSDGVSGNVYVFNTSFTLQRTIAPTSKTEGTRDAATDLQGNIYTADYRGGTVDEYSPTNNGPVPTFKWGSTAKTDCHNVAKPYGVAVDTADTPNRIYVASSNLEQVKVFDGSGNCLNVGATGSNAIGTATKTPGSSTALFQLRRAVVGAGSNPLVYTADLWGLKILTYNSSDGTIASTAQPELGNGTYPPAGNLNEGHGLAINPTAGYVFVANTVNQRVERFNLDGSNPIDWGQKGVAESTASFNWAQGAAYDAATGDMWVANTRNNRIDEFTSTGTLVMSYPPAGRLNSVFNWPMSVSFDASGTMYVADTFNNCIDAFTISGTTVTKLWSNGSSKCGGTGAGPFFRPWGVVYDSIGHRVLVADTNNNRIVSLDPATGVGNGVLISTKGTAPGDVLKPAGLTVDSTGNIWVADTGNNRVEKFTSAGVFAFEMTQGGYGCCFNAGNDQLNAPQGIGFDAAGLLYVADANNNRIQVFQP